MRTLERLQYGGGYLLDVPITAGIGTSIATDLIGGANYQRVKLISGVSGVSDGDIAAALGLPIKPQTGLGGNPFLVAPGLKLTESYTRVALSFNTINDNNILAAVAAQFARIYGLILIADSPVSIKLGETGATYYTGAMKVNTGGGLMMLPQGEPYFITTAVNKGLVVNLSAAIQVSGVLWYQQGA